LNVEEFRKENLKYNPQLRNIINNRQAWIISSEWYGLGNSGLGIRFYEVGSAYPGMTEQVKDGIITLVELL
jgi:hypothetical protein